MDEIVNTIGMCWIFALLFTAVFISISTVSIIIHVIVRMIIIKNKNRIIKKINKTKKEVV